MTSEERRRRRFSEEFKRQITDLIIRDELSIKQVSIQYEVKTSSIHRWIKKYAPGELPVPILITSTDQITVFKEMKSEVTKLKILHSDALVELHVAKAELAMYKKKYGDLTKKKTE